MAFLLCNNTECWLMYLVLHDSVHIYHYVIPLFLNKDLKKKRKKEENKNKTLMHKILRINCGAENINKSANEPNLG